MNISTFDFKAALSIPFKRWRITTYTALVFLTTLWGSLIMLDILSTNNFTFFEPVIFVLFTINFLWVSMAFWTSIIGFILILANRDPITLKNKKNCSAKYSSLALSKSQANCSIVKRTAIIMPIYNEDPIRVIAGVEATLTSLVETKDHANYDFYILSDTTNDTIAEQEKSVWLQLQYRLRNSGINVFYRRRAKNNYRKVGNIAEFCERWGSLYDYMLVLDADSIMEGETITYMTRTMQTFPRIGLLQTVPRPVRQKTFFGRFLQFAAELHSPILATGNSFWQSDTGNYWGHNAMIRIDAFMENCCLPYLSGQPPFGGEILSHDFVEAALLKRGNWQVVTVTDTVGSFEEVPSNIIDFIIRDRRWSQGNLQHLRLLKIKGLHGISRFHFLSGAMSYISSLLWLIMLCLGTSDAIMQAINSNQFFSQPYQLFPNWHIAKPELIYSLIGATALLLFTPKILALIIGLLRHTKEYGGVTGLITSTVIEIFIAILIAPVMMIFHAYFVVSALIGYNVSWNAQARDGRSIPWNEAVKHTLLVSLLAFIWGGLAYLYAPKYFWWLLPVLIGLVLAAPIIRFSSSLWLGKISQQLNIFTVPSESTTISVLESVDSYQQYYSNAEPVDNQETYLATPLEKWKRMPIQQL